MFEILDAAQEQVLERDMVKILLNLSVPQDREELALRFGLAYEPEFLEAIAQKLVRRGYLQCIESHIPNLLQKYRAIFPKFLTSSEPQEVKTSPTIPTPPPKKTVIRGILEIFHDRGEIIFRPTGKAVKLLKSHMSLRIKNLPVPIPNLVDRYLDVSYMETTNWSPTVNQPVRELNPDELDPELRTAEQDAIVSPPDP